MATPPTASPTHTLNASFVDMTPPEAPPIRLPGFFGRMIASKPAASPIEDATAHVFQSAISTNLSDAQGTKNIPTAASYIVALADKSLRTEFQNNRLDITRVSPDEYQTKLTERTKAIAVAALPARISSPDKELLEQELGKHVESSTQVYGVLRFERSKELERHAIESSEEQQRNRLERKITGERSTLFETFEQKKQAITDREEYAQTTPIVMTWHNQFVELEPKYNELIQLEKVVTYLSNYPEAPYQEVPDYSYDGGGLQEGWETRNKARREDHDEEVQHWQSRQHELPQLRRNLQEYQTSNPNLKKTYEDLDAKLTRYDELYKKFNTPQA